MASKLNGANDFEKLKDLCTKTHKEQAVWFLNAFWDTLGETQAEKFWLYVQKCNSLDLQKGPAGFELDELSAHRFLEQLKETMTVTEMRDNLRSTGAISGNVRMVPLSHILIFKYKVNWHELVNASQGDNRKEIEEAQRRLDEVQAAFIEADAKATEAKTRLREAEAAEAAAKAREAEAKAAESQAKERESAAKVAEAESKAKEAEARAAQDELEAALAELKAQEDAFNNKTTELTSKSEDASIGLVTRNKAKAELAQHLSSDPLPLRRAKITQEAAVKKADRATQAAADARSKAVSAAKDATSARGAAEESARQATQARSAAEQARNQASAAKAAAEEALEEMQRKLEEAETYFNEIKNKPGSAKGALWWMDRELHEARAYIPERKGGYRKQ